VKAVVASLTDRRQRHRSVGARRAIDIVLSWWITDVEIECWWEASKWQLDGRTPSQALQDDDIELVMQQAMTGLALVADSPEGAA
jgi:NACalpha-BTF3-like transcription factor